MNSGSKTYHNLTVGLQDRVVLIYVIIWLLSDISSTASEYSVRKGDGIIIADRTACGRKQL